MATQTKPQRPAGQTSPQARNTQPMQARRMQQPATSSFGQSHGQGQVRHPETDRRLKANRG